MEQNLLAVFLIKPTPSWLMSVCVFWLHCPKEMPKKLSGLWFGFYKGVVHSGVSRAYGL